MKKNQLLFLLLVGILFFRCTSDERPRTIERPTYGLQNARTVEIDKILLTDTSTVLFMDAYFYPNSWIRIDSATYIKADGVKYTVESSDGIILNQEHVMPESGEEHFTLTFPALPKGTKTIDFFESDCEGCFKIWDIDVTGKAPEYKPELPKEILDFKADVNYSLPEPEMKMGTTTLTVYLTGIREGYDPEKGYNAGMKLFLLNIFTNEPEEYLPENTGNNVFQFQFEQFASTIAMLQIGHHTMPVLLQPGEKAEAYYDITANSIAYSRYNPKDIVYAGFKGVFAEANNQLVRLEKQTKEYKISYDREFNSPEEYLEYTSEKYSETADKLNQSDLPKTVKQLVEIIQLKKSIGNRFSQIDAENFATYKEPLKTIYAKLNLNNPYFLFEGSNMATITDKEFLTEVLGSNLQVVEDLQKSYPAMLTALSGRTLSPENEKALETTSSPYFSDVYNHISARTKKRTEEIMSKGGFEIVTTPDAAPEKILEAIVAQYEGKAVFVDFWATWCGPCLNAMKTIKPIKPEMKEKGVVSLYISNESSPKTKWLNMLSEIGGIHYYLTNEEWKALSDKYKIQGIPTYMIFDKKGKKAFESTGYPGNDKILEELGKVW